MFQKCREVDPSGPLATLRKLLLSEESLSSFRRWILDHWYAVALIILAVIGLLVIFFTIFLLFLLYLCFDMRVSLLFIGFIYYFFISLKFQKNQLFMGLKLL